MKILRTVLVIVALICGARHAAAETASSPRGSWWKTPDQRGVELLESGDAASASQIFRDSRWRGVSQYRNGNFADAQKEFSVASDPDSLYNAGTAAARAGDYQTAVEKFEQVIEVDPAHDDATHNLSISRQLLKKQQSSDQQGDSGDDSEQSEAGQQGDEQNGAQQNGAQQNGEQQDGGQQSQQGQQPTGESQQSDSSETDNQDGNGELSTSAEDARAEQANSDEQSGEEQSAETRSAAEQNQPDGEQTENAEAQQAQSGGELEQNDAGNAADFVDSKPISESEQATEQWMRRIPDDPSQLLRNKIKLNHMIQHENVTDLPEPW